MPKANGCAVAFCSGLHAPDDMYHSSELEMHPMPDGSHLAVTTTRDDRTDGPMTLKYQVVEGPTPDRELILQVMRAVAEALQPFAQKRDGARLTVSPSIR